MGVLSIFLGLLSFFLTLLLFERTIRYNDIIRSIISLYFLVPLAVGAKANNLGDKKGEVGMALGGLGLIFNVINRLGILRGLKHVSV